MKKQIIGIAGIVLALAVGTVSPAQEQPRPRPSLNLYGTTGLIDMPSAEAQPDGQISLSYSQFGDFSRRNFTFQVLPRVSGTLRYRPARSEPPRHKRTAYRRPQRYSKLARCSKRRRRPTA